MPVVYSTRAVLLPLALSSSEHLACPTEVVCVACMLSATVERHFFLFHHSLLHTSPFSTQINPSIVTNCCLSGGLSVNVLLCCVPLGTIVLSLSLYVSTVKGHVIRHLSLTFNVMTIDSMN